jgi:hypothetical protein
MGTKKRSKKPAAPKSSHESLESPPVVDIESVNLRTAGPVTRLRGVVAVLVDKVCYAHDRLTVWGESNDLARELSEAFGGLQGELSSIAERLEKLELSGFSPPRKSFTADTSEGDHVLLLDQYRDRYADLLDPSHMDNLVVLKKRAGRGGGLILEATDGTKFQTAIAHVVRISKPVDL